MAVEHGCVVMHKNITTTMTVMECYVGVVFVWVVRRPKQSINSLRDAVKSSSVCGHSPLCHFIFFFI